MCIVRFIKCCISSLDVSKTYLATTSSAIAVTMTLHAVGASQFDQVVKIYIIRVLGKPVFGTESNTPTVAAVTININRVRVYFATTWITCENAGPRFIF